MNKDELALEVMLLRKQIGDSQYTMRSVIGIAEWLPKSGAARARLQAAKQAMLMAHDLMVLAVEEMEKEL